MSARTGRSTGSNARRKTTSRERASLIHPAVDTDFGVGRTVVHPVLCGAGVPLGEDSSKIRIGLLDTVQHGSPRHILEGSFEVKSNKDSGGVSFREVMVLIIVFAPSGRPTPYCKGPAHLATDSFFAAMTDLSANLRRKDIMRSGLWPPVGLASGVICPASRYCSTELGTAAAAICATTCTNKSLFTAREPKSYQVPRACRVVLVH